MDEKTVIESASWENEGEAAKETKNAAKETKKTTKKTTKEKDKETKTKKETKSMKGDSNPMQEENKEVKTPETPNPMMQSAPNPMMQSAPNPMMQQPTQNPMNQPAEQPQVNPMVQPAEQPQVNPMAQQTSVNPMAQPTEQPQVNPTTQSAEETSAAETTSEQQTPSTESTSEQQTPSTESTSEQQTPPTETSTSDESVKDKDEVIAVIEAAEAEVKKVQDLLKSYKASFDTKDIPTIQAKYYEVKNYLSTMEENPIYPVESFDVIKDTYSATENDFAEGWCLEAKKNQKVIVNEIKKFTAKLKQQKAERKAEIKQIENKKKLNFKELTPEEYAGLSEKAQKKYKSDLRSANMYKEKVAAEEAFMKSYRLSKLAGKFKLLEERVDMSIGSIKNDPEFKPVSSKNNTFIYTRFKQSTLFKNGACINQEALDACQSFMNKVSEYLSLLGCNIGGIVFDAYPNSIDYSLNRVHDFYLHNMTKSNAGVEEACDSYSNLYNLLFNYIQPGDVLLMVDDLPILNSDDADYDSIADLVKGFNIIPTRFCRSEFGLYTPEKM